MMLILNGGSKLKVHECTTQSHRCKYITYSESMGRNLSFLCHIEVAGFPLAEQCITLTFHILYILLKMRRYGLQ